MPCLVGWNHEIGPGLQVEPASHCSICYSTSSAMFLFSLLTALQACWTPQSGSRRLESNSKQEISAPVLKSLRGSSLFCHFVRMVTYHNTVYFPTIRTYLLSSPSAVETRILEFLSEQNVVVPATGWLPRDHVSGFDDVWTRDGKATTVRNTTSCKCLPGILHLLYLHIVMPASGSSIQPDLPFFEKSHREFNA